MKGVARLLFVAGAVGVGLFLLRAMPREVTFVYDTCSPAARSLEVDIERDGRTVRRAEFHFPRRAPAQVSHTVRVKDGDYVVRVLVDDAGTPRRIERPIAVAESTTIVIPCSR